MTRENAVMSAVPEPLENQRVPMAVIAVTAMLSLVAMLYGASLADPDKLFGDELWKPVLFGLVPWLPVFFFEAVWKYENYGFYALLLLFTLLQIGHFGEHFVQVMQLLISGGNPAVSHGVFGVFDAEYVHFVWDSLVWLGLCGLVIKLGTHNRWLLISLVAASFHEVEHVFITYLYEFEPTFYENGGIIGLLAKGGIVGSPLPRPYLHFSYNFIVVFPLLIAFWDETKRAYNLFLARALPSLTAAEKASTSGQLDKVGYEAGETIVRQGDRADRFYVVGEGEVEVVREHDGGEERLAILTEGHFFGEIGLLTGQPRTATVRAHTDVDVFVLENDEFLNLIARSRGAQADVDSEISERLADLTEHRVDIAALTGQGEVPPPPPPAAVPPPPPPAAIPSAAVPPPPAVPPQRAATPPRKRTATRTASTATSRTAGATGSRAKAGKASTASKATKATTPTKVGKATKAGGRGTVRSGARATTPRTTRSRSKDS